MITVFAALLTLIGAVVLDVMATSTPNPLTTIALPFSLIVLTLASSQS